MTATPMVHVVDDDPSVQDALLLLLRSAGLEGKGHDSAEDFLKTWRPHHPACAVVDVKMPGMNGLELQREMKRRSIDLPVVVITGHGDVAMAVQALKIGALDFIEKPCDEEALLQAVRDALAQDQTRIGRMAELSELRARRALLTEREREVMDLVVTGMLNKVVGAKLGISERTIEIHKAKVMHKMQARTLSDLIRMSIRLEEG